MNKTKQERYIDAMEQRNTSEKIADGDEANRKEVNKGGEKEEKKTLIRHHNDFYREYIKMFNTLTWFFIAF
jgi:hypothetical protein